MASSGKRKTTMAKLTRESRLRERRFDKQAKKDARKRGELPGQPVEALDEASGDLTEPQAGQPDFETSFRRTTPERANLATDSSPRPALEEGRGESVGVEDLDAHCARQDAGYVQDVRPLHGGAPEALHPL